MRGEVIAVTVEQAFRDIDILYPCAGIYATQLTDDPKAAARKLREYAKEQNNAK